MDCFYAQVEMRDNPKLKNVPLGIGGPPKSRSVLCTSNYIARKFGVKSAQPVDFAIRLCPTLIILPPNFKKYSEVSEEIFEIYEKFTDKIEPLSLDEAFMELPKNVNASLIAREIKKEIFKKTGLTASAGVSYNKYLAKIASDWKKPDGFFLIRPEDSLEFLTELPLNKLPGIGPKSFEVLKSHGLEKIKDVRLKAVEELIDIVGNYAFDLKNFAIGIDEREVVTYHKSKSISVEETYLKDLQVKDEWIAGFEELKETLTARLNRHKVANNFDDQFLYKLIIKVKTKDFKRYSIEKVLPYNLFHEANKGDFFTVGINTFAEELLEQLFKKVNSPIRLLGIGYKLVESNPYNQLVLPF